MGVRKENLFISRLGLMLTIYMTEAKELQLSGEQKTTRPCVRHRVVCLASNQVPDSYQADKGQIRTKSEEEMGGPSSLIED